jgi:hypothetical protein
MDMRRATKEMAKLCIGMQIDPDYVKDHSMTLIFDSNYRCDICLRMLGVKERLVGSTTWPSHLFMVGHKSKIQHEGKSHNLVV